MRQYQLAIVEDEPHTARYIQGIVEATNLFRIAAVCESAEELLRWSRSRIWTYW